MRSNKHYHTFPINSGNQTKWNVAFTKINIRFFVIYSPSLFQLWTMQTALLSTTFIGCQVEQNAEEEVQQFNEVDNMLYILYFKDCAVFSFNAAGAFLRWHYSCSRLRFVLCIFHLFILVQIIPVKLVQFRTYRN